MIEDLGFTIYGEYLGTDLFFRKQPGVHDGEVVLEVTADDGEQQTTVRLTPGHVRDLRLALQKIEKEMRA